MGHMFHNLCEEGEILRGSQLLLPALDGLPILLLELDVRVALKPIDLVLDWKHIGIPSRTENLVDQYSERERHLSQGQSLPFSGGS